MHGKIHLKSCSPEKKHAFEYISKLTVAIRDLGESVVYFRKEKKKKRGVKNSSTRGAGESAESKAGLGKGDLGKMLSKSLKVRPLMHI